MLHSAQSAANAKKARKMQNETPNTTEIAPHQSAPLTRVSYSETDRDEFLMWYALPLSERRNAGYDDLSEYADKHGMERSTLWRWRQHPEFEARATKLRRQWGQNMTSAVLDGWKLSCMKGNPLSIELWLSYFHDFNKKQEIEQTNKTQLGVDDIRFLIDQLPEPLRSQNYDRLRDIVADCNSYANARYADDSEPGDSADGPTGALPGETNNPTQDVPGQAANAMAESNTPSVRADMERPVHPRHNESAAWRREE